MKGLKGKVAGVTGGRGMICPGPVQTEMLRSTYQALAEAFGVTLEEWYAQVLQTIPVGRFGQPEDVATLAAFKLWERPVVSTDR